MTASDIIRGALRLIGVLAAGEQPSAAEASDALASLNEMVDSWQNDRLMVYAVLPQNFPLVPGKKTYTMGPGGDFDAPRPVRIEKCQFTYTQTGESLPLNLHVEIIDVDQYNQFVVPDTSSPIPMWLYADDGNPLRKLYFYTVPTLTDAVVIYSWQPLQGFPALGTVLALPPGYAKALRYNLALALAPEYGATPSEQVMVGAMESKALIQSLNATTPLMQVDSALISGKGGFNYLTGE